VAKLRRKTELGRQPARGGLGMRVWNRSWLLATLLGASPLFVAAQTSEPSTQPTTVPTTLPATEPTTMPATLPTTGPATLPTTVPATLSTVATQPTAAPLSGAVEGTFFPEREGRLERSKDGQGILFVYDKDGKRMAVPILPNLDLMRLENAVEESGWDLRFRASGWITEYHGKNYILFDHASQVDEKSAADAPNAVR
jgi:hypothetical protein